MTAKQYDLKEHPDHEARLPEWRDMWLKNSLNTTPMTADEKIDVEKAVRLTYSQQNLKEPKIVLFVTSPFQARAIHAIVRYCLENKITPPYHLKGTIHEGVRKILKSIR